MGIVLLQYKGKIGQFFKTGSAKKNFWFCSGPFLDRSNSSRVALHKSVCCVQTADIKDQLEISKWLQVA